MELRKKLAQDEAEYGAVMKSATPDAKRARELSGSIFDGKNALAAKAKAMGVTRFGGGACPAAAPAAPAKPAPKS